MGPGAGEQAVPPVATKAAFGVQRTHETLFEGGVKGKHDATPAGAQHKRLGLALLPTAKSRGWRCRPGRCGARWARSRRGGMAHLVCFKGLLVSEEQLVPNHLHALLRVHGKEGALDARHVPLVHLRGTGRHESPAAALPTAPSPTGSPAWMCCVAAPCYRRCGGLQPAGGSGQDRARGAKPQPAACSALPWELWHHSSWQFLRDARAQERASDSEQIPCQPPSTLLAE